MTRLGKFNYRVGAVIIDDGKILMVKTDKTSYYYSVGGRVHFGETASDAVLREVYEETGLKLEIDRPLFIHENFFTLQGTSTRYHELSIFYLMKKSNDIKTIRSGSTTDQGDKEQLVWLPIDSLSEYKVYPDFFAKELAALPDSVKFMLTKDR
ncbi:MAG: NUDIX hydrolase [Clostridiales bacterium]|nr:NUDIX hydrolase [Clostridiales bacterium]